MRVALAIPSHENVPALFAYDLAALCAFTASAMPESVEFGINMVTGTYIHSARQELADVVREQGADWVLWLDSDMRFPRDALVKLLQHKAPVVGINYSKRQFGGGFTGIKSEGAQLQTTASSEGLERVEALGMGCLLMRGDVFAALPDPAETPWFQHRHLGGGKWMGEDVWFCQLLREAGVQILADHDLSLECTHVGQMEYTVHTAPPREEAA